MTGFAGCRLPSPCSFTVPQLESTASAGIAVRHAGRRGDAVPHDSGLAQHADRRCRSYVMYGATEAAARLTYLDPTRLREKAGSSAGASQRRHPDREGNEALAAPTRSASSSPAAPTSHRATGTLRTRHAERFGPLGYRTGDLGYADEDGDLFLVGRRHDMLKVGAHRVGAKEIEDVLSEVPGFTKWPWSVHRTNCWGKSR